MNSGRRLTRSTTNRWIGGVCAGLANYWNVDPLLVRLGFILLVWFGVSPVIYLILWAVLPADQSTAQNLSQQVNENIGDIRQRVTVLTQQVRDQVQPLLQGRQTAQPPTTTTTTTPTTTTATTSTTNGDSEPPATGPTRRL
jgi:phage shock protein C